MITSTTHMPPILSMDCHFVLSWTLAFSTASSKSLSAPPVPSPGPFLRRLGVRSSGTPPALSRASSSGSRRMLCTGKPCLSAQTAREGNPASSNSFGQCRVTFPPLERPGHSSRPVQKLSPVRDSAAIANGFLQNRTILKDPDLASSSGSEGETERNDRPVRRERHRQREREDCGERDMRHLRRSGMFPSLILCSALLLILVPSVRGIDSKCSANVVIAVSALPR